MSKLSPGENKALLKPLPYHLALRDFLRRTDPQLWDWFASLKHNAKAAEEARFELLKSTYRIERQSQSGLYEAADVIAAKLGLAVPITIYQSQHPQGLNASLAYLPGEIHVVLHGPIATQLTSPEIGALLAHEFSHYLLFQLEHGELLILADMLTALTNDSHSHPAHRASWRLLSLYTEIFCDRGAYLAVKDVPACVATLVKVATGVKDVSAESYLRQAEEIFSRGEAATDGVTHPEAFIRARAVQLWAEGRPDNETLIERMIEGRPTLDGLDLLGQERMAAITRSICDALLGYKWFQTDLALSHARLYFEGYVPPAAPLADPQLPRHVSGQSPGLCDYYCYVLLDFASVDRELDEPPLAAALVLAEQMGIKARFVELARQELRLRKNQIEKIDEKKAEILANAEQYIAS